VVLLAESVEEDTLRALETPQFPISVMTLARFQDEAGQFLAVDTLFPTQPQGESQNGGLAPDVADSFFAFFGQIEDQLAQDVFSKQKGWHWHKTRKWSRAGFSRWHQNWQGLTVGSGEDEERNQRVYVGVVVDPKFAKSLAAAFSEEEPRLRKLLGNEFVLDDTDKWTPIWEYVTKDPDIVIERLRKYRDVLSPYLDRILPSRKKASAPEDTET
jgi:hypothetical protein